MVVSRTNGGFCQANRRYRRWPGLLAMPIMRVVKEKVCRRLPHAAIPLQQMVMGANYFPLAHFRCGFTTGFIGIGVAIIGTSILGLIPPRVGIRRSRGMGIIIVPIMIYTFSQAQDAFGFLAK